MKIDGIGGARRVTLHDVAARAGVSTTTASYILNGRSEEMRISQATQGRVRAAADELAYRPNPSARNLRTSTTRSVGLISDRVAGGPFGGQMILGATRAARALDHTVLIGESEGDPDLEAALISEMLDQRVDGIMYARVATSEIEVPGALLHQRVVLLNCLDPAAGLPAVVPDEYEGGRSAAEALLASGIGNGIYVVGERPERESVAGGLRLSGIRDRLALAGARLESEIVCPWAVRDAMAAVSAFLEAGGAPRGLLCMNDRIAMGTYQALAEHGLSVPDDVSVVSFDGSDLATWLRPQVTSVVLPYAELGTRAIELVLDDSPGSGVVTRIPMPVMHGQSVMASTP